MGGCASTGSLEPKLVITNKRVGLIIDGKIRPLADHYIGYVENHICTEDKGGFPCMHFGFGFDVNHFQLEYALTCIISVKANPRDISAFAEYPDGTMERKAVLDLHQIGSPVILGLDVTKDKNDHGLLHVKWACQRKGKTVVSDKLIINMGD
jgi:hypothetical protein